MQVLIWQDVQVCSATPGMLPVSSWEAAQCWQSFGPPKRLHSGLYFEADKLLLAEIK